VNRHGQKMLAAVFPEMMRWLWRDAVPYTTDPADMQGRAPLSAVESK
jgi:hypothetical protein